MNLPPLNGPVRQQVMQEFVPNGQRLIVPGRLQRLIRSVLFVEDKDALEAALPRAAALLTNASAKVVSNTAARTSVLPPPAIGSFMLPANPPAGKVFRLRLRGTYQTPMLPLLPSTTVLVEVTVGGVTVAGISILGSVLATSSTVCGLWGEAEIVVYTPGSAGQVTCAGFLSFGMLTLNAGINAPFSTPNYFGAGTVTKAVDLTVPQAVDVKATWASAQVGQGTTITVATLEALN